MPTAPIDIPVKVKGLSDLQKLEKRMEQLERDLAKVSKVAPKAANGIRQTGRAAATATGNVQRFGVAFRTTLGPIVALTGALTFFNRSLAVLSDREADIALLENGLTKLGANDALVRLKKQADEFGNATLFNEEDFLAGAGLLTSFTDVAVKDYQRVIDISADLAQTNKGAVKDSLLQVAKALNAPSQNLSALSRSGIQFTETQKDLVKSLEATGQKAAAQKLILQELEKQYGGNAVAAATGLAGAQDTLNEEFRDFQKVVAEGILPVVIDFTEELTNVFRTLKEIDPEVVKAAAEFGVLALKFGAVVLGIKAFLALKTATLAFLGAMKVKVLALNAALLANPYIAAAAGLTALGVGIVNLVTEQQKAIDKQKRYNDLINKTPGSVKALETQITGLEEAMAEQKEELKRAEDVLAKYEARGITAGARVDSFRQKVDEATASLNKMQGTYDVLIRVFTKGTADVRGGGTGPGTFNEKLANTIKELDALGYDYNGGNPIKKIGVTPTGSSGGGGSAAKPRESQLPGLQEETKLRERLLVLNQQQLQAQLEGDAASVRRLEGLKAEAEFDKQIADINREKIPEIEKEEKRTQALLDLDQRLLELRYEELELDKQRKETIEGILLPIQDEIALLQGRINGNEEEIRQNQEILALKKQIAAAGGDPSQAAGLIKTRDQLREQAEAADELKQQYESLANSIASNLTDAFKGIITGAKSTEEALADAFQGIADAFLDMAMKMIQQWLVMQIMGIVGGGGGAAAGGGGSLAGLGKGMFSFAGGGYTGDGARSGGVDGQGGFPAILHPQESVVDHTKMASSMSRWNAGQSGGQILADGGEMAGGGGTAVADQPPQININGGVTQINNEEFIRMDQLPSIIAQSAQAGEAKTLRRLRMSPGTRRQTGI